MTKRFLPLLAAVAFVFGVLTGPLRAQTATQAQVVSSCGSPSYTAGTKNYITVDTTGKSCTAATVTPSGTTDVNLKQVNGQTVNVGTGAAGTGTQRVTTSTDSTLGLVAGSAIVGKVGIDQTTPGTTNAVSTTNFPTTVSVNTGATGASSPRVTVATDTATIAGSAPGTAGASSTNVLSVQGIASGTKLDTNVAQINGVTTLMGNGVTGTGSQRVTIASDNTAFSVVATQPTFANLNAQVVGSTAAAATDSGNPVKVGGKYNSTLPTYTDGQRGDFQINAKGLTMSALYTTGGAALGVNTSADGAAVATGLNVVNQGQIWNGSTWDRQPGNINGNFVQGTVAAGVSSTGNPVQAGCYGNSSAPSAVTNAQRASVWCSLNGALSAQLVSSAGIIANVTNGSGGSDGQSNTINSLATQSFSSIFDGSTWNRQRQGVNAADSTGTGFAGVVNMAQGDDASIAAITENQFGNMRMVLKNHALITQPYESPENSWQYASGTTGILSNTTTAVTIKASAGGSLRNYLNNCTITTTAFGAAVPLAIRDGAGGTVIWSNLVSTGGWLTPVNITFNPPIRGTAATLMEIVTPTANTSGTAMVNCQGYVAP